MGIFGSFQYCLVRARFRGFGHNFGHNFGRKFPVLFPGREKPANPVFFDLVRRVQPNFGHDFWPRPEMHKDLTPSELCWRPLLCAGAGPEGGGAMFLAMNQRPRGFAGAFGVLAFLPIHYPIQRVHGDSMAITLRPCDRGGCGRGSDRS